MKKLILIMFILMYQVLVCLEIDANTLLQKSRWPNDIRVVEWIENNDVSMDVDINDDIYLVTTKYVSGFARGEIWYSWDDGLTWGLFNAFSLSNNDVEHPSICVTANYVVVVFRDWMNDYLWSYRVRKDLSGSNMVCVYNDYSQEPSIDNLRPTDNEVFVAFRGDHQNGNDYIMFTFSVDEGGTWSSPDTVNPYLSGARLQVDGAITTGVQNTSQKIFITYRGGNLKNIYVRRSNPTGWDLVYQTTVGAGFHIMNPVIRALQYGTESTLMLYYERHNDSSSDRDLAYAYSTSSGDPGTWTEGYHNVPSFNQWHPQIGVGGFGHNYFYISYWDWYPDGVERAWVIYRHKSNPGAAHSKIASVNADEPYDMYEYSKTAVNWTIEDTIPVVAWLDGRNAPPIDIYCNLADSAVGIEEKQGPEEEHCLFLQTNPNPVYSYTHIQYSIPKECFVELKVYNSIGREIATLIEEKKPAGNYTFTWDIRNWGKEVLPNGVYFCRLKAGNCTETKKMVIVR